MDTFVRTVLETVRDFHLFRKNDTVFVALSGGADSVALLYALLALKEVLEFAEVRAVHVHHGIRGEYADRDERFVCELCETLSVPLSIKHVDVPAVVSQTGESVEDAARRLRYACFDEAIGGISNAKIATAHTSDDQAETILFRLIRGCGLNGVCGIPVSRDAVVRPLIRCSSHDVRTFCEEHHYAYVVDETNFDLRYSRNRIRHEILPSMKKINPAVDRALIRFAEIAEEDNRFLNTLACNLLNEAQLGMGVFSIPVLMQADPAVRKRALYRLCQAEYMHITRLNECLESGGTVNLPQDRSAVSDGKTLRFLFHNRQKHILSEEICLPVCFNEPLCVYHKMFVPRLISQNEFQEKRKIHKNLFDFCISYDMIEHDLILRSRKCGDSIRPYGRGCTKTLKKLLNDCRIPADKRADYPVLVSGDKVLMVLGLCVDESVAVTPATGTVLWFDSIGS